MRRHKRAYVYDVYRLDSEDDLTTNNEQKEKCIYFISDMKDGKSLERDLYIAKISYQLKDTHFFPRQEGLSYIKSISNMPYLVMRYSGPGNVMGLQCCLLTARQGMVLKLPQYVYFSKSLCKRYFDLYESMVNHKENTSDNDISKVSVLETENAATNNTEDETSINEDISESPTFISDDSIEDTADVTSPEEESKDSESTSDIDTTEDTDDFLDIDLIEDENNTTTQSYNAAIPICIVGIVAMIIGLIIGILVGGSGESSSVQQNEIKQEIPQQTQEYMTEIPEEQIDEQSVTAQHTGKSENGLFDNTAEEEIPLLEEYETQKNQPEENLFQEESETTYEQTTSNQNETVSVTEIVRSTTPAVVTITNSFTRYYQDAMEAPIDSEFTQTGVIVGQNYDEILILTTYSNLEYDGTKTVKFVNEKTAEGTIKGFDSDLDLAVVAVKKSDLDANTIDTIKMIRANKYETEIGESVLAIGANGDYQISSGLVSGKTNTPYLIITDASIHNGNTGGPLVNMKGELVGINDARYINHSMSSLSYAIPISTNYNKIGELLEGNTEKEPGYLGILCTTVDVQYKYLPRGVMVVEIDSNSACSNADIKEYDIITKIDNVDLETSEQLAEYISNKKVGDTVVLTTKRMVDERFIEQQISVVLQPKGDETILESIKNEISES